MLHIYIYIYIGCAALSLISCFLGSNLAFADNVDYTVNVAPSLNVSVSSSSVVLDLNPNTKTSDSKDITVKVGTNNITGYKLTMSSTGNQTNLVKTDDNTKFIPTLSAAAGTTASSLADNTWGYRQDNTGNFLPYTTTEILSNTAATNEDATTLSFASKINYNQAAGSYAIDINFVGTTNPLIYYMQDLDPTLCTTTPMTVVDNRDNQEYTIQRLADGNCWMMNNLNLGAVDLTQDLTSANTNLSTTVSASDFNAWDKTDTSVIWSLVDGMYVSLNSSDPVSDAPYGTLYNYCAASAGAICNSSNSDNARYDLCPSGWRLPTGGSGGEFDILYTKLGSSPATWRGPITSGGAAFTLAGYTNTPIVGQGVYGFLWSSTRVNNISMYDPYYVDTTVWPTNADSRERGCSLRCILKEV